MSATDPRRSLLREREELYGKLKDLKKEASGERADLLLRQETVLADRIKTLLTAISTLESETIYLEEIPPPEAEILKQRISAYRLRVVALQEQFNGLRKEIHQALGEKPSEDSDLPPPKSQEKKPSTVSSAPLPGKRPWRRFEYPEDPDLPPKDTGPDVKKKHNEVSEVADVTTTLDNPGRIRSVYGPVVYGADEGVGRDHNEDRVAVDTKGKPGVFDAAFAVIDGMGGHGNGDRAAQILGETILANLDRDGLQMEEGEDPHHWKEGPTERVVLQRLAQEAISRSISANQRAGAVYSLAVLLEDKLKIYHAGDTKVVVFDVQGNVKLETTNHGIGSSVRNSVSGYRKGFTDVLECTVQPGDRIMFTSDGLTDNFQHTKFIPARVFDQFDAASLYELIKEKSPEEAMRIISADLKDKMAQGEDVGFKQDNRSVIIVDIDHLPNQATDNPPEQEPDDRLTADELQALMAALQTSAKPGQPPEQEPGVEVSDAEAQAVIDALIQERVDALDILWINITNPQILQTYPEIKEFSEQCFSDVRLLYISERKEDGPHDLAIQKVAEYIEYEYEWFRKKETELLRNLFQELQDKGVVLYDDNISGPYTIERINDRGTVTVRYEHTGSAEEKYSLGDFGLPEVFDRQHAGTNALDRHTLAPFASDPVYDLVDRERFAELGEQAIRHISDEFKTTDVGETAEQVLGFWSAVFQKIEARSVASQMDKAFLYRNLLGDLCYKHGSVFLHEMKHKTPEDIADEYCDRYLSITDAEVQVQFETLANEMKRGDMTVWEDIERVKQMDPSIGGEIDDIVHRVKDTYKQAIDSKRSREEAVQDMRGWFIHFYQELVNKEIDRCYDVLEICKDHNTPILYTDLGEIQIVQVDQSANRYTIRTGTGEEKEQWLDPDRSLSSLIHSQFVGLASRWGQEFVPLVRDAAQSFFFHLAERMRLHNPSDWRSSIEGYWGPLLLDMETEAERLYFTKNAYAEFLPWVLNHVYSLPVADLFPVDTSDSARQAHMIELFRQFVPNIAAIEKQAEKRKKEEEKQQQKQEKKDAKQRKKSEKQEAKKEQHEAAASVTTAADVIKERLKIRKEPGLTAHWWWVKNYIRFRLLQEKDSAETKADMADVHEFLAEKLEKMPAYFKKEKDYKAHAEKLLEDARIFMGKKRFDTVLSDLSDEEATLFWRGGVKQNGDDRITIVGVERLLDRLIVHEKLKPAYMARFYEKMEESVQNGAFSFETLELPPYPDLSVLDDDQKKLAMESYQTERDEKVKAFEALVQQRTSEIYRDILEEERKEVAEAMFEEVRKGTKGNESKYKKAWGHYQEIQQAMVVREIELGRGVLAHLDQEFRDASEELNAYARRKAMPIEWGKDRLRKYLFLPRLKNKTAPYPVEWIAKSLISGGGVAAGVYGADVSFHALSDVSKLGPGEPLYDTGRPYLETIAAVKAGRVLEDQVQKRTMVRNRFWPAFHRQAFTHRAWELIPGPLRHSVIAGIRLFTGGKSTLLNFEAFRDLRHAQESIAEKHKIPMEIIEQLSDNAWLLPKQMEDELNALALGGTIAPDQIAQARTHLVEAARRIKGTWNPFTDTDSNLLSKESRIKPRDILKKLAPEISKIAAALEEETLEKGEREALRVEESLRARLKELVLEIPAEKWTSGRPTMQAYLEEEKNGKRLRPQEDTDRLEQVLCDHANTIRGIYSVHVKKGIYDGKQALDIKIRAFVEQQKQGILAEAEQKKVGAEREGDRVRREFLDRANVLRDLLEHHRNAGVWQNAAAMHAFLDTQKTNPEIGEEIAEGFRDYLARVADEIPKRNPPDVLNDMTDAVRGVADQAKDGAKQAAEAAAEDIKNNLANTVPAKSAARMKGAIDGISEDRWILGKESMETYLDNLVSENKISEEEKNVIQETLFSLTDTASAKYASEVETEIDKAKVAIEKDWIKNVAETEKNKKIQEVKDDAAIKKQLFEQGAHELFTRLQDDPLAWFGKGSMKARLNECERDDAIGVVAVDRMKSRLLDAAEKVRGSGGKPEELLKEVERRMVVAEAYQLANHHWRFRKPLFDEENYRVLQDIRIKLLLEIIPSELLSEREVEDEKTGEKNKEIEISFKAVSTFLQAEKKKLDALRTNISREKRNVWIKRIISLAGGGVAGYAIGAPFSAMVFGAKAAKSAAATIPLAIRRGR